MDTERQPRGAPGFSTDNAPAIEESRKDQRFERQTLESTGNGPVGQLETSGQKQGERRHLEVLVVEDEPLVAMTIVSFLRLMGHRSTACFNGETALSAIREQEFDLALVDLGMPEMDGWEICRRINKMAPDVPVIVSSGRNVTVEEVHQLRARVSGVLSKPYGSKQLTDMIRRTIAVDRER